MLAPDASFSVARGGLHCGLLSAHQSPVGAPVTHTRLRGPPSQDAFCATTKAPRAGSGAHTARCRRNLSPWYFRKQAAANFPNTWMDALKTATSTHTFPYTIRFSVLRAEQGSAHRHKLRDYRLLLPPMTPSPSSTVMQSQHLERRAADVSRVRKGLPTIRAAF